MDRCATALVPFVYALSPRERGWTSNRIGTIKGGVVIPARAGMDRLKGRTFDAVIRYPRASGDGPPCLAVAVPAAELSPRERGWT